MSLCSIVPLAPLTDDVFPFNSEHFTKIRQYQQDDLGFLSSPPVRALVGVGDIAGSTATGVVGGVTQGAQAVSGALFGGLGKLTSGLPGGHLLGAVGKASGTVIGAAGGLAGQLVDPSKVVREHINYSNYVKDNLPGAMAACDQTIHDFAVKIGNDAHLIYDNAATQGIQLINDLEGSLEKVVHALVALYTVLSSNNIQENLQVGQEKYIAIDKILPLNNHLGGLSIELPFVLASIASVKLAFDNLGVSLKLAKSKIGYGVTDPTQIFAQTHEDVSIAWRAFEVRRKTMTYLPYNYPSNQV